MTPSPSLGVYSDALFLDELHRRISKGAIRIDLALASDDWAKLNICTTGHTPSSFEAMAYPRPIAHL